MIKNKMMIKQQSAGGMIYNARDLILIPTKTKLESMSKMTFMDVLLISINKNCHVITLLSFYRNAI